MVQLDLNLTFTRISYACTRETCNRTREFLWRAQQFLATTQPFYPRRVVPLLVSNRVACKRGCMQLVHTRLPLCLDNSFISQDMKYIAIISRDAKLYTKLYTKVPLSNKNQLNMNLNITWALIISGTYFLTQ